MRHIELGEQPECVPILLDGRSLYIGLMVHACSRHQRQSCHPAVVVDFDEKGACSLSYVGGTVVGPVPYNTPGSDDPNSRFWHFIIERANT